jgi:hypothetical protein
MRILQKFTHMQEVLLLLLHVYRRAVYFIATDYHWDRQSFTLLMISIQMGNRFLYSRLTGDRQEVFPFNNDYHRDRQSFPS